MRHVALIILAPVSSKTDVTTSSYEGFKFCTDARVNALINVKARMQVQKTRRSHPKRARTVEETRGWPDRRPKLV